MRIQQRLAVGQTTEPTANVPTAIDLTAPQSATHRRKRAKDPIIVLHIQKTAGSAFKHYLEGALPREQIITSLSNDHEAEMSLARYAEMTDAQRTGVRLIFGHLAKVFYPRYPDAPLVTFVRDPFERTMSQYIYERRHAKEFGLREDERPLPSEVSQQQFI